MTCPECYEDMAWVDYYGTRRKDHYWTESYIEKVGDIWRCNNEEGDCCDEYFYTDKNGKLHRGYPC